MELTRKELGSKLDEASELATWYVWGPQLEVGPAECSLADFCLKTEKHLN